MTLLELRERVSVILRTERQPVLSPTDYDSAINHAKDIVARALRRVAPEHFRRFKDFTVNAGDAYVELPSSAADGGPVHQIESVFRIDRGVRQYIALIDLRDSGRVNWTAPDPFTAMFLSGDKLYFASDAGAPEAMTLRISWLRRLEDLDGSDLSATWAELPDEWQRLIPILAAAELMPASTGLPSIYRARFDALIGQMIADYRRSIQAPIRIRDEDEWYG